MKNQRDCVAAPAGAATSGFSKLGPDHAERSDAGERAGTVANESPRPRPRPIRGPEPKPTCPSHSILIPHRGRQKYLDQCLASIHRSAAACGSPKYETIVIEPPDDGSVFNKSILYNRGIAKAHGDVISFIDADMLVGPRWMEGVAKLVEDPRIVRLCYRVRRLSRGRTEELFGKGDDEAAFIQALFHVYDHFELASEAYRAPDRCRPGEAVGWAHEVYGNSQFSITREKLADIRYDERYEGKGREDWEIARQMQRRYGTEYRGFIWTDAEHAMFHVWHDYNACLATWADPKFAKRHSELWEEDK